MLLLGVLALLFTLTSAAPNAQDFSGISSFGSTLHRRSAELEKRNECWVDTDCPVVANAYQSTCNPTRCCDVHCKPGYSNVWGQCHKKASSPTTGTSPSNNGCPSGKRLFNGVCVAAPGSALSPKRQCNNDNDCTTGKGHSYATCQNGSCSIVCWQGYKWNGSWCARDSGYNCAQTGCVNGPAGSHLIGVCRADGRCSSVCEQGYTFGNGNTVGTTGKSQYRCYKSSPNSCANVQCKQVMYGGTSSCSNGKCSYSCSDPKKTPVEKPNGKVYCENINNNPQCCGADCKRCPSTNAAYAGLSLPIPACKLGVCAFRCVKGVLSKGKNGLPYCA